MPEETLDSPVTILKNVGAKRAALYEKLGVFTVRDLLRFYPRTYIDYTDPTPAAKCADGENGVIKGTVIRKFPPAPIRKGLVLYKLIAKNLILINILIIFYLKHVIINYQR